MENKTAIITGGTSGLGLVLVKTFLQKQCNVVFCARTAKDVQLVTAELSNYKDKLVGIVGDIRAAETSNLLITSALSIFKSVDIVISNAGVQGPIGPIEANNVQDWKEALDINLYGPIYLTRAALPIFKENRSGKLIFVSGGGATSPMPMFSSYATAKAGLIRFMETVAMETREYGITVNAVAPGALKTRFTQAVLDAGEKLAGKEAYNSNLQRETNGGADPQLAANLCYFLASQASQQITGKLISAQWDNWPELNMFAESLAISDIYTLRRITEKERPNLWKKK